MQYVCEGLVEQQPYSWIKKREVIDVLVGWVLLKIVLNGY
jgi:hypothetical protein